MRHPAPPESYHLSVRPDHERPAGVHFLFERQEPRLRGALGISVLTHLLVIVLLVALGYLRPDRSVDATLPERLPVEIVWVVEPGPGGGGGGGGDETPEPPAVVELPGDEVLTVPAEPDPEPVPEPQPDPEPQPLRINVPAVTMAAASAVTPGVIEPSEASRNLGPGTGGGADSGRGPGIGPGDGRGLGAGRDDGIGGDVFGRGSGVTDPVALREVRPEYTIEAMRARVQGTVWVQGVVRPDGTLTDIEVVRSLDRAFGLDDKAIEAVRQWQFLPGTLQGEPVAVRVIIEIDFALR